MTDTPPVLPPTIRTRLRRIALALAALLLAWLAMSQFAPRLLPPPSEYSDSDHRPPPAWPEAPPAPPPPPPPAADMHLRLQALEERLARLESAPANEASAIDGQRLATVEVRLEEMEQRLQKNASTLSAVTLFHQMKEAVLRGDAYRDSWNRLNALSEGRLEMQLPLQMLAPYADTGVATLEVLKAEFETAALRADETPTSVSSALQSLVRVRKVGEAQKGNDDESVIARAEAKLARGEVALAFKELGTLSPKASARFAGWMEQAQGYVIARQAVDSLQLVLQDTPAP